MSAILAGHMPWLPPTPAPTPGYVMPPSRIAEVGRTVTPHNRVFAKEGERSRMEHREQRYRRIKDSAPVDGEKQCPCCEHWSAYPADFQYPDRERMLTTCATCRAKDIRKRRRNS